MGLGLVRLAAWPWAARWSRTLRAVLRASGDVDASEDLWHPPTMGMWFWRGSRATDQTVAMTASPAKPQSTRTEIDLIGGQCATRALSPSCSPNHLRTLLSLLSSPLRLRPVTGGEGRLQIHLAQARESQACPDLGGRSGSRGWPDTSSWLPCCCTVSGGQSAYGNGSTGVDANNT
jgi:hypothetical protein